MNRLRKHPALRDWMVVAFAAGQISVFPAAAAAATNLPASHRRAVVLTNLTPPLPPLPQTKSPVQSFRELLAMSPAEQQAYLTNRPPEIRERILAKIHEYQALDVHERELRLRATELRWYLLPLMREAPTNRAPRLAAVPDDLRGLVKARLNQWDILPPAMKQEFLENERALRYFSRVNATNGVPEPGWDRRPPDADQQRWNALSDSERRRIAAQFNQFFELTTPEKRKTLEALPQGLSAAEREQMEKTLQTFDQLPPLQRVQCVRAFTEFASMSPQDRQDFLRNAERWSQLPAKERQTWRDLVAHVPQWPPLPPGFGQPPLPPMPPRAPPNLRPTVATNRN